ncbi:MULTISPECIES: Crp/Fnr family transcriptional regulator [Flavobacterium]|uniref:Crp/Fnr family transcriptional regulator n=1 Tax=Flavobacterium TaxID=237 RepID=UPI0021152F28|nr:MULTISPECIES: Crp/Fnr family transcriptional regulator [Flavobacterium]UUF13855.1 Crp/Fnr family transcriptional regulator [Flavobacterium panici]
MLKEDCNNMLEQFCNHLDLFHKISLEDKNSIAQYLEYRSVKEGEILIEENKIANEIFFVCNGVLKIASVSDKGNDVIHFFFGENHFCTILKSFTENIVSQDIVQAACDTEIIVLERNKLDSLIKDLPYFKPMLDTIFQQALLNKVELRNFYLGTDATSRYQKFIERQPNIASRVSQTDIASYLGIAKQSLSRIKKNAF